MRLIDADKVKQYAITEGFYCDTDADKEYTAEKIDQLFPTVEAIPVEWIKEFVNVRAANDGMDCYWHFWGEDVLQMIDQWRKENAID